MIDLSWLINQPSKAEFWNPLDGKYEIETFYLGSRTGKDHLWSWHHSDLKRQTLNREQLPVRSCSMSVVCHQFGWPDKKKFKTQIRDHIIIFLTRDTNFSSLFRRRNSIWFTRFQKVSNWLAVLTPSTTFAKDYIQHITLGSNWYLFNLTIRSYIYTSSVVIEQTTW